MPDLTEQMQRAVGDAQTDLVALTRAATEGGRRIRLRRAAGAVLAVSLTAASIVGGAALLGRGDGSADRATFTTAPSVTMTGQQVPITGRAITAALLELVAAESPGEATGFAGQDPEFGQLRWMAHGTSASVPVQINVQQSFSTGFKACKGPDCSVDDTLDGFYSCRRHQALNCTLEQRGTLRVLRYEERAGDATHRWVDVFDDATDLRVVVGTTNGDEFDKPNSAPLDKLTTQPPLTLPQLETIATWPQWGPTIDKAYADAGATLEPYLAYPANVYEATPAG